MNDERLVEWAPTSKAKREWCKSRDLLIPPSSFLLPLNAYESLVHNTRTILTNLPTGQPVWEAFPLMVCRLSVRARKL